MKSFYTSVIIVSFCLTGIFFLIFGFTFLKHFTDWKIADVKETVEFWNLIITPTVAIVGTYFVVTSFRQQVEANKIQREALENEKKRYDIDRGYEQTLNYLNEIEKFKSYITLIDNTNIEHQKDQANIFYAQYLFYKSQYEALIPKEYNTIRNMAEFYHLFLEYLQIVEMAANNLIDFYKLQDKSFLILRKKFHKDTNSLRGIMATILNCQIDNKSAEFYYYIRIFTQVDRTNNVCLKVYNLGYENEIKIF